MPRISVILPVKDGERFISSAIRSTLASMPRDSELVVLDDASRDGTPEILSRMRDRRLRVITGTESNGLASGLNRLIAETDSEWLARMDADDICLPWRFMEQRSLMHRGVDFIFSPVLHLGPSRYHLKPTRPGRIRPEVAPFLLLLENPFAHSTAMFRRSAVDGIGGYRSVGAEDYDLWLRAATAGFTLARTSKHVLLYRHHSQQVTRDADWQARSRTEKLLVESHSALSERLIGVSGDSVSALRAQHASTDAVARVSNLLCALEARFARMSPAADVRRVQRLCQSVKNRHEIRGVGAEC